MKKDFADYMEELLGECLADDWRDNVPQKVKIIEVVTRDGFQAEEEIVSTEDKIKILNAISETGVAAIEATSFVRGDVIPQLADAADVMKGINKKENIIYSVLVPNMKGAQKALECGADEWGLMVSLSEEHSRANVNCSRDEAIEKARMIVDFGKANCVRINGGVLTAFKGSDDAEADLADIILMVELYRKMGIDIINVADTEGCASPREVYEVMHRLVKDYPDVEFVGHFHNTGRLALQNALAAVAAGVYTFDCAVGGLGGCPAVPDAGGNLSTERFVKALNQAGIETGVDMDKLQHVNTLLAGVFNRTF